jgi:RimJ/RimL family protein N-acetyltransferase
MNPFIETVTLTGANAILEPLSLDHHDDLAEATRDGKLWRLWYTTVPSPEGMEAEIRRRLNLRNAGSMSPWAVRSCATGKAVGMTTYMNIDAENRRVEIGSTWYAKSAQRTPINTECKLMLLRRAFEPLACIAVEFRTAFFNHASRRAIERFGAKTFCGTLDTGLYFRMRIEPSPVRTASKGPPPFNLPRSSERLIFPEAVTGNSVLMRPSPVWTSRSA